MYQLKNLINRKYVPKKPKNDVAASEEFFTLVTEAHILSAAMSVFGMKSVDDEPPESCYFPHGCSDLDPKERKKVLMLASKAIVERFIDLDFESGDAEEEDSTPKPKREDYIQS